MATSALGFQETPVAGDSYYNDWSSARMLAQPGYNYEYKFGDFLSGGYAAGRQAEAQAELDAREWRRNEYSAQQQRAFEEYMDSTKVQRQMADIQAAGLNPWLAVQNAGFGGSTPQGASGSASAGQVSKGDSGAHTAMALAMIAKVIAAIAK